MAIHIDAVYSNGVLLPATPIDLPDSTPVHVTVTPRGETAVPDLDGIQIQPRVTPEEFERILQEGAFRAPSLPADFSRDDI
jgi:predicted DNA-binding antitoxin AbrB/MazE fold protein